MSATPAPTEQGRIEAVLLDHTAIPCSHSGPDGSAFWWACFSDGCGWTSNKTERRDDDTHIRQHVSHVAAAVARDRARDDELAARVESLADELSAQWQAEESDNDFDSGYKTGTREAEERIRALLADQ